MQIKGQGTVALMRKPWVAEVVQREDGRRRALSPLEEGSRAERVRGEDSLRTRKGRRSRWF